MRSRRSRRRLAALVVAVLVGAGACGSDDEAATGGGGSATTEATDVGSTTTATDDAPVGLAQWSERGPHGVGSVQIELEGRRVAVWYPAEEGAGVEEPTETFDVASLLSPELQALVPSEVRRQVQYRVPARPGAAADLSGGPYPVVLFSHGFAGFPEQSVHLTTHLASWGYVVAAPDHVERSLSGLLGTAKQGVTASTDPEVLAATLDLVVAQTGDDSSPLSDLVDAERVAVAGHSAGAGAAYRLAGSDDRIDAFASYSLGRGREPNALPEAPDVPGLVMLGDADATIEPGTTREVYETLASPKYLAEVADSGHLAFSDLCLIGADQGGLIGLAEEIDLPIPEDLKALGTDGCGDQYLPVTEAFPVIDALSVAFLRAHLDGDDVATEALVAGPVRGLDSDADVTLTVEP